MPLFEKFSAIMSGLSMGACMRAKCEVRSFIPYKAYLFPLRLLRVALRDVNAGREE